MSQTNDVVYEFEACRYTIRASISQFRGAPLRDDP